LADKSHTASLPANFSYKQILNKNNKINPNLLNKTAKLNQISLGNQTPSQTLYYQQHLTSQKSKQNRHTKHIKFSKKQISNAPKQKKERKLVNNKNLKNPLNQLKPFNKNVQPYIKTKPNQGRWRVGCVLDVLIVTQGWKRCF
jgi:hypothetical protein